MIKVEWREANSIVLIHIWGVQSTSDFLEAADRLSKNVHTYRPSRILFDWSQLQSWPFREAKSASIASWVSVAAQICRVAIIHERRWNRQAAWVAAIMRLSSTQVRSWHCEERDHAIEWLCAKSEEKQSERIRPLP
jgi:hypothetical protein